MCVITNLDCSLTEKIGNRETKITCYQILNCNSIKQAFINVYDKCLNIKYGFNGTGKTTIAKAIYFCKQQDELNKQMLPYDSTNSVKCNVIVSPKNPYKKIMIFNEDYVNKFIIKKKGDFCNTFDVLLKDEKCEQLENNIESLISKLSVNSSQEKLNQLYSFVCSFEKILVDYKQIDSDVVDDILNGYGLGFKRDSRLASYECYYSLPFSKRLNWAQWRCNGITIMGNKDHCPFCMRKFKNKEDIDSQNSLIKKVLNEKTLELAENLDFFFETGITQKFLDESYLCIFKEYLKDKSKKQEVLNGLKKISLECSYIKIKLDKLFSIKPGALKKEQIDDFSEFIQECVIECSELDRFFKTDTDREIFETVNGYVKALSSKLESLKGLFTLHRESFENVIKNRTDDINDFLSLADFPYCVEINKDERNIAVLRLKTRDENNVVKDPGNHLSFGEKNCFALIMFMFESCSLNADLIILDDPISGFDKRKKFAITARLFAKDKMPYSFHEITTILLTHDMQPIIDYVYLNQFNRKNNCMLVKASFLRNLKGCIKDNIGDSEITKDDIKSVVESAKDMYLDSSEPLPVRIVALRRYIEFTDSKDSGEYDYLSSLVHGYDVPQISSKTKLLPRTIKKIEYSIQRKLHIRKEYSYKRLCYEMSTRNLLSIIEKKYSIEKNEECKRADEVEFFNLVLDKNIYSTMIIARLILNRNGALKKTFQNEHFYLWKMICEYLHIEDDYLFQLNPKKMPDIPCGMYEDLIDFFRNHLLS